MRFNYSVLFLCLMGSLGKVMAIETSQENKLDSASHLSLLRDDQGIDSLDPKEVEERKQEEISVPKEDKDYWNRVLQMSFPTITPVPPPTPSPTPTPPSSTTPPPLPQMPPPDNSCLDRQQASCTDNVNVLVTEPNCVESDFGCIPGSMYTDENVAWLEFALESTFTNPQSVTVMSITATTVLGIFDTFDEQCVQGGTSNDFVTFCASPGATYYIGIYTPESSGLPQERSVTLTLICPVGGVCGL